MFAREFEMYGIGKQAVERNEAHVAIDRKMLRKLDLSYLHRSGVLDVAQCRAHD